MGYESSKSLKSVLGRVRGLGSARKGFGHWRAQRLTAIGLIPLSLWFIVYLAPLLLQPPQSLAHFLKVPVHSLAMILFIMSSFYHGVLGLQIIIEDYIHCPIKKTVLLVTIKGFAWVLTVLGLFLVLILNIQA